MNNSEGQTQEPVKIFIADFKNKILWNPEIWDRWNDFDQAQREYNRREEYPATWLTPEMDGKEMSEGIDFRVCKAYIPTTFATRNRIEDEYDYYTEQISKPAAANININKMTEQNESPNRYEIDSFEKMINIVNKDNFQMFTTDFLLWLHYTMITIQNIRDKNQKKYKNKTNWQILKSVFIWIDDGKNEIDHFQIKDINTGQINQIKVTEKDDNDKNTNL